MKHQIHHNKAGRVAILSQKLSTAAPNFHTRGNLVAHRGVKTHINNTRSAAVHGIHRREPLLPEPLIPYIHIGALPYCSAKIDGNKYDPSPPPPNPQRTKRNNTRKRTRPSRKINTREKTTTKTSPENMRPRRKKGDRPLEK